MKSLIIITCLLILQHSGVGQSSSCPTFGTDQSSRLSRSREDKTFLNFESPAQCRGNVTGWRFCYYRNVDDEDDIEDISGSQDFAALFMVYRRQSATSNNYISVPESVREKTIEWRYIRGSRFQCTDEILTPNEYFEIQKNDVIGACIKDTRSIESLLLVGTTSNGNYLTYQSDRSGYDYCFNFQYRTIDTSRSDFTLRSTSTLHLYANIVVAASCTAGSNIAAADAVTSGLSGTYLNVESPVSCNNHITKWHYCYYPQAATPGSTLSMTVAVWSLDGATNTYIVNPNSIKTITIQPVQTLAKIFCVEESLSEAEYVLVSHGDVIGVSFPSIMAIPVLGSNANPSIALKRHLQGGIPSDYRNNDLLQLTSHVLHLYATIENRAIPTTIIAESTTPEMTVAQTTTPETTTGAITLGFEETTQPASDVTESKSMTNSDNVILYTTTSSMATSSIINTANVVNFDDPSIGKSSFGVSDVVAIVLSIVLITIAIVLISLFGIYLKKKRRRNNPTPKPAFENRLYCEGISSDQRDIPMQSLHHQPYDYVYETPELGDQKNIDSNLSDYDVVDDENYYAPDNSVHAYLQEIELLKRGSAAYKPEIIYTDPGRTEEELYTFLKNKKINNISGASIRIGGALGSGNFGTVYEGEWKQNSKQTLEVALKYPTENATKTDRVKFLQEAVIMAQFKHPNVVALYGVSTKNGTTILVVELLSKGDLRKFLQSLQPDPGELVPLSTPNLLLQFSQQICLGMNYLANIGFIHRDLAARNILISNSFICKIADFGMSRDLNDNDYYTSTGGGKIPLKWTAPEAIHYKKYSTASDVWSYGCVLYEIWSLGHKPFETAGNVEVLRVIETEARLAPPPGCPRRIYQIMMQCWAPNAQRRPNFKDILLSMLENEEEVLYIPLDDVNKSYPQAATLGASLKMGLSMYKDIQKTYMTKN